MTDIGEAIRQELLRQERTVSWLARKLNCTRAGVYRLMNKRSMDTQMLYNVSLALGRNFFADICSEVEQAISQDSPINNEAVSQNDTEVYQQ